MGALGINTICEIKSPQAETEFFVSQKKPAHLTTYREIGSPRAHTVVFRCLGRTFFIQNDSDT